MSQGRIIILNGVSSAGKTTLARIVQDRSPTPLYRLDIDDFILMSPDKFNDYENGDFSVEYRFASKFFHVVKLYSDFGFDFVRKQSLLHKLPMLLILFSFSILFRLDCI